MSSRILDQGKARDCIESQEMIMRLSIRRYTSFRKSVSGRHFSLTTHKEWAAEHRRATTSKTTRFKKGISKSLSASMMDRERTNRTVYNMNPTLVGKEVVVAHKPPGAEVVADSMSVVVGIGVVVSDLFSGEFGWKNR